MQYVGKLNVSHSEELFQCLLKLGLPVEMRAERLYYSGPRCEPEQRFFILGCLRMWKEAEAAGHISKITPLHGANHSSQNDMPPV